MIHLHNVLLITLVRFGIGASFLKSYKEDPLVGEAENIFFSKPTRCSCDCCYVNNRLPGDNPLHEKNDPLQCSSFPEGAKDDCPKQCRPGREENVLDALSNLDYSRYCYMKCVPTGPDIGDTCRHQTSSERIVSADKTGNGNHPTEVDFQPIEKNKVQAKVMTVAPTEEAPEETKEPLVEPPKLELEYKNGKAIAARKRAQAASSMASAANSLSKIDLDAARAHRELHHEKAVAKKLGLTENDGITAAMDAQNERNDAEEDLDWLKEMYAAALKESKTIAKWTADTTAQTIKQQTQKLVYREAIADVIRYGWNKPKVWPKVLSARAAEPYQQALAVEMGMMRAWDGEARKLLGQAKGKQKEAQRLTTEKNLYKSQGDLVEAARLQHKIDGLLGAVPGLEASSKQFHQVALDTSAVVPKFQIAASEAAAYVPYHYGELVKEPSEDSD